MILGRVVGQVWAARADARLRGAKLLVVRPHGIYEPAFATGHLVAVDDVDAGVGDDVIVCLGRPARLSVGGAAASNNDDQPGDQPIDAAILGVVDRVDLDAAASTAPGAAPGIRRPLPSLGGRA
jgi:ethanolamine utilization protein EutN